MKKFTLPLEIIMINFLTDENVATSVALVLRRHGFDVKDIKEEGLQGTSDKEVLQLARREHRVVITHDKDFGGVLFHRATQHEGVILLRFKCQRPDYVIKVLLRLLKSAVGDKFVHNVTIVSEDRVTVHKRAGS